ncbi:MAG: hypothetical protein ACRC9K_06620 [Afipia sp.]
MLIRKTLPSSFSRAVVLATAAALVLTVAVPPPVAQAAPAAPAAKAVSATSQTASEATDFSARRRYARRGYRNNNAAGLAFMGLALGTVGAIVAEQRRRDYYRDNYYYGGNPYYGNRYYGVQPYYGGGYYGY